MNRKQREQNKQTAKEASYLACTYPECGERGKHWLSWPQDLGSIVAGIPQEGFYTCAKFYGEDGRRIL